MKVTKLKGKSKKISNKKNKMVSLEVDVTDPNRDLNLLAFENEIGGKLMLCILMESFFQLFVAFCLFILHYENIHRCWFQ